MEITIITVCKKTEDWIRHGVEEYLKRMPPELPVSFKDLAPEKRHKSISRKETLAKESKRILSVLPKDDLCIALDEKGKQHNTMKFSEKIDLWTMENQSISFIIGSADGIDPELIAKAHESWSLSNFTMPHQLIRVILVEQIYRAWSILANHPYHRE